MNMSYCRFHNTEMSINDCIEAIETGEGASTREKNIALSMFESILNFLEDNNIIESSDTEKLELLIEAMPEN